MPAPVEHYKQKRPKKPTRLRNLSYILLAVYGITSFNLYNIMYNKENLLKMADYIETVPQEKFGMELCRSGYENTPECTSIGCIIGHCTVLDTEPLPRYSDGGIDFYKWSKSFIGIGSWTNDWDYLFASSWAMIDNTPTGAAKRIRHYVENGLPENWRSIMYGNAPLPY